jgi:hypothetical protein
MSIDNNIPYIPFKDKKVEYVYSAMFIYENYILPKVSAINKELTRISQSDKKQLKNIKFIKDVIIYKNHSWTFFSNIIDAFDKDINFDITRLFEDINKNIEDTIIYYSIN